jgi:hypothetical protein
MVRAVAALIEFSSLVRRSVITEDTLKAIDEAINTFHRYREIFSTTGVRPTGFSLPRQHSLVHYRHAIQKFGALNGLCSSITENRHIKAVKKPWRRSSRNNPLGQMLLTNQRLDKLSAARADFTARGMMDGPCLSLSRIRQMQQLEKIPEETDQADTCPVDGLTCLAEVKLAACHGKTP